MFRSTIGLSKLPVSTEADPGFGPDTEQRRVEFAAKLEEETFSIACGDATKLARANLIIALKLWEREDLIPLVKSLDLNEIMIIWLVFEFFYLAQVWPYALDHVSRREITQSIKVFQKFLDHIFQPVFEDIPKISAKFELQLQDLQDIRNKIGGDLLFGLKKKNDQELVKLYEITYSKLPQSLRDKFKQLLTGVTFELQEVSKVLEKSGNKDVLAAMIRFLLQKISSQQGEAFLQNTKEMLQILEIFDSQIIRLFHTHMRKSNTSSGEIQAKVKKYYGIE